MKWLHARWRDQGQLASTLCASHYLQTTPLLKGNGVLIFPTRKPTYQAVILMPIGKWNGWPLKICWSQILDRDPWLVKGWLNDTNRLLLNRIRWNTLIPPKIIASDTWLFFQIYSEIFQSRYIYAMKFLQFCHTLYIFLAFRITLVLRNNVPYLIWKLFLRTE